MSKAVTDRMVIMAAGVASRMKRPPKDPAKADRTLFRQADERSKGLIGVGQGGSPFLDYLLYNAREAGLHDIVLVVRRNDEAIRNYYGAKEKGNGFHGLALSYAYQDIPEGRIKPLGTADALLQALFARPDWKGGKFIVANSDNLYSVRSMRLLLECGEKSALPDYDRDGLEFEASRIAQFGITRKDPGGYLLEIVEKPGPEALEALRGPDGILRVSMNIFLLDYDLVLPYLESCPLSPVRQEKELVAALTAMTREHPRSLKAIPWHEHVPDLSTKDDLSAVQDFLRKHYPDLKW
jgi:glucose-1-phosphate adenylyltransferase